MSSYEIVKKTIRFEKPERIPLNFRSLGYEYTDAVWLDSLPPEKKPLEMPESEWIKKWSDSLPPRKKPPEMPESEWIDEWGVHWKRLLKDGGHPIRPALENWDSFKEYKFPNPNDPKRYEKIKERLSNAGDKYVIAGIPGLGVTSRFIRGFSNWAEDFYLHPEELHQLIEGILDYQLGVLQNYSKFEGIHGINLADDWGTQSAPFISIPMFRKFYKPYYRKLFESIHSYGWDIWMHSDGKIDDLVEELIDCGLDVWSDLCQPRLFDIEKLGNRYRGRVCFEVTCDIQATMPTGNKNLIKEEAELLFRSLSTPRGGFMAEDYHTPWSIGVSLDMMEYLYEIFKNIQEG